MAIYKIERGFGHQIISEFKVGDKLDYSAFNIAEFSQFLDWNVHPTKNGSEVVSAYDAKEEWLEIIGYNVTANDFIFNSSPIGLKVPGTQSNDILFGGLGNDVIGASGGNDIMSGGKGNDTYYVDSPLVDVHELAGEGTDCIIVAIPFAFSYYLLEEGVEVEKMVVKDLLSQTELFLEGNEFNQTIVGNAGSNELNGNGGDDILIGGPGADSLTSGMASYAGATNGLIASLADPSINTNDAEGDVYYDVPGLIGSSFVDTLNGDESSNTLIGGAGDDTMTGGLGSDTYRASDAGDVVVEVAGEGIADRVITTVSYALTAGAEVEFLSTNSSTATVKINLTGNALKQEITGNYGDNVLHDGGKGAADHLRGLSGNDTYRVFNSGDTIVESGAQGAADKVLAAVSYVLGTGVHVESLQTNGSTGTAAINLAGNEIAQTIIGNNGANRLEGKGGADTLRGYGGADTFVFATKLGSGNIDTILDFNPIDDRFLLSDAILTALTPGTITAAQFRANTTGLAQDATDRIVYDTDDGKLFYDADGIGGATGIQFATVGLGLAITHADFAVA